MERRRRTVRIDGAISVCIHDWELKKKKGICAGNMKQANVLSITVK